MIVTEEFEEAFEKHSHMNELIKNFFFFFLLPPKLLFMLSYSKTLTAITLQNKFSLNKGSILQLIHDFLGEENEFHKRTTRSVLSMHWLYSAVVDHSQNSALSLPASNV